MNNLNTSLQILPICGNPQTVSQIPTWDPSICIDIYKRNCPTLCDSPSFTYLKPTTPLFTNFSPVVNASNTSITTPKSAVKPAQAFSTTFSTALTPFQSVEQNVLPFPSLNIRTLNFLMKNPDLSDLISNMRQSARNSNTANTAISETALTISETEQQLAADQKELQTLTVRHEQLQKDLDAWKSSPMGKRHAARALQQGTPDNSQGGQLTSQIADLKKQTATLEERIAQRQETLAQQKEILEQQQSELETQEATLLEQQQALEGYIQTLESDDAELGALENEIKQLQKELKDEIQRRENKKSENTEKLNQNNIKVQNNDEQIRLKAEQAQKNAALKAERQEQIRKLRESLKA